MSSLLISTYCNTNKAVNSNSNSTKMMIVNNNPKLINLSVNLKSLRFAAVTVRRRRCHHSISNQQDDDSLVEDLRVPDHWLLPSKAFEESEWLRVTLHKWLDDEYCPEDTNIEISKVAAQSYYKSLLEKETDLGEILLMMARELESISYRESFHGAFSSANAAVNLIVQRIEQP